MRLIDADRLETHEQLEPFGNGNYEYVEVVYKDDIDDAPTIEPERKGEWVKDAYGTVVCSECKGIRRDNRISHINWCNSCGCRMIGGKEFINLFGISDRDIYAKETIEEALCDGTLEITAEPEQRWIPVSERLPEEDTDVLVSVYFMGLQKKHGVNEYLKPSYYVDIARCYDGEWSSYSDEFKVAWDRHKVIAWQPLPEAYKGE